MSSVQTAPPPPAGTFPWKGVLLGCGITVIVLVAVACCGGFALVRMATPSSDVSVTLAAPAEAAIGQEVDLVVTVTNAKPEPVTIGDIDIADTYLEGFTVVSTDPAPVSRRAVSLLDMQSFTHQRTIPPGGTQAFTIRLRAQASGIHRGDVDVYEGIRCTTNVAETVVR